MVEWFRKTREKYNGNGMPADVHRNSTERDNDCRTQAELVG